MITRTCHLGHAYEIDIDPGSITPETFQALNDAQDEHQRTHHRPAVTHIRKQVNPRRRRGSQFYSLILGEDENGSQTLCGAPNTSWDAGWGEARYARNLARVTCEACKGLR